MTPRDADEYSALRDTIGQRGTARVWIFTVGLIAWAGLAMATAALASLPIATLLPLLVLAGVFDAVLALHLGVERIGRYLQVFHEDNAALPPCWEHVAMAFGKPLRGTGVDPLFTSIFLLAALGNFVPVLIAEPVPIELVVVGSLHVAFIARVIVARRAASHQRGADLERYQKLRHG
jgi:hypothetical protein